MPRTDEQKRAKKAWDCVSPLRGTEPASDYLTPVRKFPVMVLTNGLGQSLAFLRAKEKDNNAHQKLSGHLSSWVLEQIPSHHSTELLKCIINEEGEWYRRATAETLAFTGWLKRFAEAELSED